MSADYYLTVDTGGPERHTIESFNVTYNLGPMLRAAGFPDWHALRDAPASEAGGMLRSVADRLRSEPEQFREFNPPNGWGTYEGAIEFCERFAAACADHPKAVIEAWL